MKNIAFSDKHIRARRDMVEALRKHDHELCDLEMLAVASQVVGNLIALQDETSVSADFAMQLVLANIEEGNRAALEDVSGKVSAA